MEKHVSKAIPELIAEIEKSEKQYIALGKKSKKEIGQLNEKSKAILYLSISGPLYAPIKKLAFGVPAFTRSDLNDGAPVRSRALYNRATILRVLKELGGHPEKKKEVQTSLDFSVSDDVSKAISDLEKRKRELLRLSALKKEVEELEKGLLK